LQLQGLLRLGSYPLRLHLLLGFANKPIQKGSSNNIVRVPVFINYFVNEPISIRFPSGSAT
jgi:hypothetical protein